MFYINLEILLSPTVAQYKQRSIWIEPTFNTYKVDYDQVLIEQYSL